MEELVKEVGCLNEEIEGLVCQLASLKHECLRSTDGMEKVKLENHAEETVAKITAYDKKREKLLREIEKRAKDPQPLQP
ncbi:MAG: hypothetical protein E4G77_01970 [Nitrosopumilus sp.]|nr:MAG: hypothetical protein E4G77_01970 [Nitrosopumilus sp.]